MVACLAGRGDAAAQMFLFQPVDLSAALSTGVLGIDHPTKCLMVLVLPWGNGFLLGPQQFMNTKQRHARALINALLIRRRDTARSVCGVSSGTRFRECLQFPRISCGASQATSLARTRGYANLPRYSDSSANR
jgi:hypothetical protein